MSNKRKRRGRKVNLKGRDENEQYFAVPYRMAQSDAFRSLKPSTVKVWIELRTRFNGFNAGEIFLGQQEGARLLGLSKSTIGRALAELEGKGFIVKTRQGIFAGGCASTFRLTDVRYNGPATQDWKSWRRPQPTKKSKRTPAREPLIAP